MSDFKFDCPSCGQSIVCDTSNAGMQIPCPVCQAMLTVPRPEPSAPAVPSGPAKLGINKSAHQAHSAPPPAAANAPAKPAWGAKPEPLPAPKKKSPLIPILIVLVVLAALAGGWFGFGAPYLKQQQEKKQQAEEEARRQAEQQAKAAAEAAKPKKAAWTLDLGNAKFPERPAAGKLHGDEFKVDIAVFQSGRLILAETNGLTREFIIPVPLNRGETLQGKSLEITSTNAGVVPPIGLTWKEEGSNVMSKAAFQKGYAMKLQIGSLADGAIPGKIYLCVPDAEQSFVAGNFQLGSRNPGAQPVPAGGMQPTGPSRRRGS